MKKWVIVTSENGNEFEQGFFDNKDKAIEDAISSYHALSDFDKKDLDDYYVGLFECEKINGRWFIDENNSEAEEIALLFDTLKNGRGIEYDEGMFYELDDAKEYFRKKYTEDFDEEDIDNFNEELDNVNSFMELVDCLESWKKTFEDKRVFEVLYK